MFGTLGRDSGVKAGVSFFYGLSTKLIKMAMDRTQANVIVSILRVI
jgi:hypothetical protein